MRIRAEGHVGSGNENETCRHAPDVIRGVIQKREEERDARKYQSADNSAQHRESAHGTGFLFCFFQFARTQYVTHHDAYGFAHCDECYTHEIPDGGFDVERGNGIKASI